MRWTWTDSRSHTAITRRVTAAAGAGARNHHLEQEIPVSYRAIVVGLGGLGSATLYRLAGELGPGVLGLEQFELGHARGASQDHSRIIRLAQHQEEYAALAAPAYKAWHEVEAEACQQIVTPTGGLVIEDRVARAGMASGNRNIEGYTAMFDRYGVAYERLDADERPGPAVEVDAVATALQVARMVLDLEGFARHGR